MTRKDFSIACVGECMIELSSIGEDQWRSAFAGDTFNTLWTMRGLLPEDSVLDFVSAFGDDPFSRRQIEFLADNRIGIAESPHLAGLRPGIYTITLNGYERSFDYWRSQSAARQLASDFGRLAASLKGRDLIYFSGITLAILTSEHREVLFKALSSSRTNGAIVAFDPNYRARLWETAEAAKAAFAEACRVSDFVLPTFEDEQALFQDQFAEDVTTRLCQAGVREVVVKCGAAPARFSVDGKAGEISALMVEKPIDTTGAGDAFNGGYLASRLQGRSSEEAIRFAHLVASTCIQTKGALVAQDRLASLVPFGTVSPAG